ncbi:hypothetical protein [Streptomyces sp. NPDC056650]|uniref:hypothetical protein n=1 Tax=Streptomyces sp. NPDC056650 TaxID=3154856 RepID=UPI00343A9101
MGGFGPATALGNGRDGQPGAAPYDRILSTCTMWDVPKAWLEQRPDGREGPGNVLRISGLHVGPHAARWSRA